MARASVVFDRADWLASAKRAFAFVRSTLWKNGRLLATTKDGRAHLNAYVDDYAFLVFAAIELLQAEFDPDTLAFAEELADVLIEQFEDPQGGGFFFTSHDHERLIHRPKPGYDNATPSGNGMAALALQRLSFLTGDTRYAAAAERALGQFYPELAAHPGGHTTLLMALEERLAPTRTIILRGPSAELARWRRALARKHAPATLVLALAPDARGLPAVLAKPVSERVNAWVCEGVTCMPPVDRLEELLPKVSKPVEIQ
jgi:uncharacterized protein